jgi:hypothetical protein
VTEIFEPAGTNATDSSCSRPGVDHSEAAGGEGAHVTGCDSEIMCCGDRGDIAVGRGEAFSRSACAHGECGIAAGFKGGRRRSRAAAPELPDRDAELLGLVGEVVLNARAGEHHDPDRQHLEHRVVAFEGRCLGVPRPVGLEGDLRHLAVIGPFGGDAFGALR